MSPKQDIPYVSRGGLKLAAALESFDLDVTDFTCADLGCNTGGFTDCLLQRGAAKVFAVDTGYGALDWKLRNDPRVIVMERTNAMHVDPPEAPIDLVTIDLAWTRQRHAVPAALRWQPKHIITLIKPHYETDPAPTRRGILTDDQAARTFDRVLAELPALHVRLIAHIPSPIRGGGGKSKTGNIEYLALLQPL
ncbi:MAG: TlyA family rRNA (cytidine-2'-O)-methyltransferase [Planctomycetaceae bacterium]|nr:TlyA family rRNA (cytidine-2'-O)-methyltransferase [Planctomycetaceae bacterium]